MKNRLSAVWIAGIIIITGFLGFIEIGNEIASGTDISGIVYDGSGGPWTLVGSPYIIVDDVIIPAGQTLTIEPGVEVKFDGLYEMFIEGNLSAIGNPINMIKFTSNSSFPSQGSWRGIYINSTGHADIEYCNITYAKEGISLLSSQNNTITNNKISTTIKGIYLHFSSFNNITDNYISDGWSGIFLFSSSNNNISNNELLSNHLNGIQLSYSSNNILLNNQIQNSDQLNLYVLGSSKDHYNNTIPTSNTANGRPIYYFYDIQDEVIEYLDAGHIILAWCENVILRNSRVINSDAISLSYVRNSTVNFCNTSNSRYGILLSSSLFNNIAYNNVTNNTYGIYLYTSSNNWVYNNNIIDNFLQGIDDQAGNYWNRNYPIGGNYWSDYTGIDLFSGPNQDIPGNDGIGDTNYTVDSGSVDNYPLMKPYLYKPLENYSVLMEGWNLISIPLIQADQNLMNVLEMIDGYYDAVQRYDSIDSNDHWKHNKIGKPFGNDLFELNETMGIWIHITQPGDTIFIYNGTQPTVNQTISLTPGWNLVGYPSMSTQNRTDALNNIDFGTDVDAIWTYNATTQKWKEITASDNFEVGRGYWMHSKVTKTWIIPL